MPKLAPYIFIPCSECNRGKTKAWSTTLITTYPIATPPTDEQITEMRQVVEIHVLRILDMCASHRKTLGASSAWHPDDPTIPASGDDVLDPRDVPAVIEERLRDCWSCHIRAFPSGRIQVEMTPGREVNLPRHSLS